MECDACVQFAKFRVLREKYKRAEIRFIWLCGKSIFPPENITRANQFIDRELKNLNMWHLINLSKHHKVITMLYENLRNFKQKQYDHKYKSLLELLQVQNKNRKRIINEVLKKEIIRLDQLFSKVGIQHIFIKGAATRLFYPENYFRDMNDIDILVPDLRNLIEAYGALKQEGYKLEDKHLGQMFSIKRWDSYRGETKEFPKSVITGHLHVAKNINLRNEGIRVVVDILCQAMPVSKTNFLRSQIWKRMQYAKDGRYLVPSPEDCLLLTIAHSFKHDFISLKDLNDIFIIIEKYGEKLAWDYVLNCVKNNGISFRTNLLFNIIKQEYKCNKIPKEISKILKNNLADKIITTLSRLFGGIQSHLGHLILQIWAIFSTEMRKKSMFLIFKDMISTGVEQIKLLILTKELFDNVIHRIIHVFVKKSWPAFFPELPNGQRIYFMLLHEFGSFQDLEEFKKSQFSDKFKVIPIDEETMLCVKNGNCEVVLTPYNILLPTVDFIVTTKEFLTLNRLKNKIIKNIGI